MTNRTLLFYIAAASTFIAGVLHLAIVPIFFAQMPIVFMIFFVVSGLAQLFWVIPTIKKWSKPWFYVGIGGTVILIIMYFVAVPGSGHPISPLDAAIEASQIIFIILCSIIIFKHRTTAKGNKKYKSQNIDPVINLELENESWLDYHTSPTSRQGMKVHLMTYKDNTDSYSSWCTLLISESTITARAKHTGRGKYRIIEDKADGKYSGTVVDASDIFHCNL